MAISETVDRTTLASPMSGNAACDHLLIGVAALNAERRLRYYNQPFADFLSRQTGLPLTTRDLLGQELPLRPLWDSEPADGDASWQFDLPGSEGVMVASRQGDGALSNIDNDVIYLLQLLPLVEKSQGVSSGLAGAITHGHSESKEKVELLTSFSHEFRTPLNAVLGFGNLLLDEVSQPGQRGYVEGIIGAGTHLLKLVNEILTLSKAEYDCSEIDLRTENVDVAAVISECVALMEPMAREAGAQIVQKGDACHLICDQTRLRQIILNLLSNAIKYNRVPGEVVINSLAVGNRCAGIEVQDSGLGIPEELTETIFNPFKRLLAGVASTEGSGIGLMLARRLVNMMGGRIRVSSRVGRGSVFAIDFNLDDEMAGTAGKQTCTVLCLGEDGAEQKFIRQLLAVRQGIEIICEENLNRLSIGNNKVCPDLIIFTADPQWAEAYQANVELRELLQRVPGIAVCDSESVDSLRTLRQLQESGGVSPLDDSFTPIEFYSLLDQVLVR